MRAGRGELVGVVGGADPDDVPTPASRAARTPAGESSTAIVAAASTPSRAQASR